MELPKIILPPKKINENEHTPDGWILNQTKPKICNEPIVITQMVECFICNKPIKAERKTKRFCSEICSRKHRKSLNPALVKEKRHKGYLKNRNKELMDNKMWRMNHPERVKELDKYSPNMYRKYKKHKFERSYVNTNRDKIISIIGTKCKDCNSDAEETHHLSYDNLPRGNLQEYCKYLVPLCQRCHIKRHTKYGEN